MQPRLTSQDVFFWQECVRITYQMVCKLVASEQKEPFFVAGSLLHSRSFGAAESLRVLIENARHDFALDAAVVLRALYDAVMQGLYILADHKEANKRALMFLDYIHVERHEFIRVADSNPSRVARRLRLSPQRPQSEPQVNADHARVRDRYLTKKGKLRVNWYPGSLRDLASEVGYESEYEILQKDLSASVHSSPLALQFPRTLRNMKGMVDWGWILSLRLAGRILVAQSLPMTEEEKALYESCQQSLLGEPEEALRPSAGGSVPPGVC